MNHRKERQDFAKSRPLPPFGVLLKWFTEVLQLRHVATYNLDTGFDNRKELERAFDYLGSRTSDDVFAGQIVKDETKQGTCKALAICLRELPGFPLGTIPLEQLAEWLRDYWNHYERTSGLLSSISQHQEEANRPLIRHAVVELAVRAGALAYLCNDADAQGDKPIWSQDAELKQYLRALMRAVGTRDDSAENLRQSKSEVGRWLDDLDVPPPSAIRKWESLLAVDAQGTKSQSNGQSLWRLYVGRRIWNSMHAIIPDALQDDLPSAYSRIKHRVHAYLRLEKRITQDENRQRAILLVLRGRISDVLLAAQVMNGESDVIWRRHIEAVLQIDGAPTTNIVRLCQTWAAVFSIFDDSECVGKPKTFDEFIRAYYLKAERGGTPPADYARLLEELSRRESKWDLDGAAACAMRLVSIAPFAAGSWHALGRIRRFQKNREATELCFRTALKLDPTTLDARTDLVVHLAFAARIDEAQEVLDGCADEQKIRVEWRFAHGLVLLSLQQTQDAMRELLKCAQEGFVPGVCYQFAAIAAEILSLPKEVREYRKRAAELGAAVRDRSH
jgi:tetratricopeptide (TPR) repeat protein